MNDSNSRGGDGRKPKARNRIPTTTPLRVLSDSDKLVLLTHPDQMQAVETITALIAALRECTSPGDYFEFQRYLFGHLYKTYERRSECARNAKRLAQGRKPDPAVAPLPNGRNSSALEDWVLEEYVYSRIARQFQSVGDALAWRLFKFDRRKIIALSSNSPPGPFFGKTGLDYELGRVQHIWEQNKNFALLHDLTNCLRIADITEFTSNNGALLHEVKKTPHTDASQLRQTQMVVDAVMGGGRLPGREGDARFVEVGSQYKTDLHMLESLFSLAHERGWQGFKLRQGRAIVAVDVFGRGGELDPIARIAGLERARGATLKRAGIERSLHHLTTTSADLAARSPVMAPFGIYPISPHDCGLLICDYLMFESIISGETLERAASSEGLSVVNHLPTEHGEIAQGRSVMTFGLGKRNITLHSGGVSALQFELVLPDIWAKGLREVLEMDDPPAEPNLIFADEWKAWR